MDSSRTNAALSCAALALLVFTAAAVGCAYENGYLPIRRFDEQVWRDPNRDDSARVEMIEWLVRSGRLDGLTRPEVLALLGPPSDDGYFDAWDLVYRLGPERGFLSIDSEWLAIRIGRDGHVSDYRIMRD